MVMSSSNSLYVYIYHGIGWISLGEVRGGYGLEIYGVW